MRAPATLACLVGALVATPIRGAGGTTTDGAVTLTYGAIHWSADPVAHLVGTEPSPATDILVETGWWYRAEGDTREYPLPPPDTESYYAGGQIEAEWSNLDGKGFHVRERVYVFDKEGPSGGFWSTLDVQNNNATARSFSVFHYLDVDAAVHRITGSFTTPASVGNNNWRAVAVGDFGKGAGGVLNSPDIVWQNDTSGKLVVWHMNLAGARTSGTFTTPDTLGANKVVVGPR